MNGIKGQPEALMDNTQQFNKLVSFMWNIANDVLVDIFDQVDYKKVILPMMVLRRIDVLLEPTKEAVLKTAESLKKQKITNQEPVLTAITKYPFVNTSKFTMKTLTAETNPARLKMNFLEYLDGYSKDVQDIVKKFELLPTIDKLSESNRLGSILEKFTDKSINLGIHPVKDASGKETLPGVDNHMMGTVFEELLRRFNEAYAVVSAGRHFTPRDMVQLLADLTIVPIADKLENTTYTIYDGACGTGGILSVSKEKILDMAERAGKKIKIHIFGQELMPDTYATCKADIMISGQIKSFHYTMNKQEKDYIAFGSTISQDGHIGENYDFCISNPPFGTSWKEDLKNWEITDKKDITDSRFVHSDDVKFIPDISDPQMLFLANNISRMKDTPLGTRIVEVHNGSSLFTGDAGSGNSNLRSYIIENDMLEAIIAMPENDFYNTGIGTYIWIVTNRKEERRKGKVQLIDATEIKTSLRKNLGEKNCETNETDRAKILKLLMDFKETEQSKIFDNSEFGYWSVPLMKPVLDEKGNSVKDKKGNIKYKAARNETEQVPMNYPGGIEAFYENEVKPYTPDVIFGEPTVGYELSFTKYFYKPVELRSLKDIKSDIMRLEKQTEGALAEILE
jgi:type I restriction enzyme M protein